MSGMVRIFFWGLSTALAGFSLIILFDREKRMKGFELIGVSFLLGIGILSIQMFVMGLCGIGFNRVNVLLPWLTVLVYDFIFLRKNMNGRFYMPDLHLNTFEKMLVTVTSFEILYVFFRALIRPIESYDSVAIHALKSKMLYLAGGITPDFFNTLSRGFRGAHPDYPLFISFVETWFYVFIGAFNDFLVKGTMPLIFLAFLFTFYSLLRKLSRKRTVAILLTFMLASIAQFSAFATVGYPDLYVGMYFSLSVIYLYLWLRDPDKGGYFYLSMIFSVLLLWIKNEGLLLVLINLFLIFLFVVRNWNSAPKRLKRQALIYFLVVGCMVFTWRTYCISLGLVNEDFNLSMICFSNIISGIRRIPFILYEYQKHVFGFKKWNLVWIIMLVLMVTRFKKATTGTVFYLSWSIFLFFIAYSLIYMFSVVDIKFFLSKTTSRFLLHILPICVFWMRVLLLDEEISV